MAEDLFFCSMPPIAAPRVEIDQPPLEAPEWSHPDQAETAHVETQAGPQSDERSEPPTFSPASFGPVTGQFGPATGHEGRAQQPNEFFADGTSQEPPKPISAEARGYVNALLGQSSKPGSSPVFATPVTQPTAVASAAVTPEPAKPEPGQKHADGKQAAHPHAAAGEQHAAAKRESKATTPRNGAAPHTAGTVHEHKAGAHHGRAAHHAAAKPREDFVNPMQRGPVKPYVPKDRFAAEALTLPTGSAARSPGTGLGGGAKAGHDFIAGLGLDTKLTADPDFKKPDFKDSLSASVGAKIAKIAKAPESHSAAYVLNSAAAADGLAPLVKEGDTKPGTTEVASRSTPAPKVRQSWAITTPLTLSVPLLSEGSDKWADRIRLVDNDGEPAALRRHTG